MSELVRKIEINLKKQSQSPGFARKSETKTFLEHDLKKQSQFVKGTNEYKYLRYKMI